MRRRFTKRALSVAVVAAVLVAVAATAQAGWLYVLAAGTLGIVASSFLYRHRLADLEVMRSVPARMRAGDEVRVGISVTNHSSRSVPAFRIEDRFPPFEGIAAACERLGPDARAETEPTRRAGRRGAYTGAPITISCGAPFGFMRSTRTVQVASPAVVLPSWVDLRSFPILEPSSFPSDVLHERARTGAGEEFLGVRDYRPGDSPRSVHWRSTARAGHLMVREYEEPPSTHVALVLTGIDHGTPPDSAFETLVSAAASIALYALATGHPLDLVRTETGIDYDELFEPGRDAALEWLATARPVDGSPVALAGRALARLGRRGTVVLCSPTAGRAGSELERAARLVQTAGARVLVVAARSSTWSRDAVDAPGLPTGGSRTRTRVIGRGESLRACLEG